MNAIKELYKRLNKSVLVNVYCINNLRDTIGSVRPIIEAIEKTTLSEYLMKFV